MELWLQAVRTKRRASVRRVGTAIALLLWATAFSEASTPGEAAGTPARNPVRIQSEQLVAEMATDTAEFSGAVRVEGDGYTITADSLTIQFKPGTVSQNRAPAKISAKEITRMTARGSVRIRTETLTAGAEQAVYEPDSGQLRLMAADPPPSATPARQDRRKTASGHREVPLANRAPALRVQVILQPTAGH